MLLFLSQQYRISVKTAKMNLTTCIKYLPNQLNYLKDLDHHYVETCIRPNQRCGVEVKHCMLAYTQVLVKR